jgi:hypothetical protein
MTLATNQPYDLDLVENLKTCQLQFLAGFETM